MGRCHNCGQELIEIDNRGERLIGCFTCNLWAPADGDRWVRRDGWSDVFAVPECTLDRGPGKMSIARIVAHEWQTDGYLKPGKIVGVRRLTTDEFMSDVMAARVMRGH